MIARAGKKARKAGLEVDFRSGLVESLPFPGGQFDVVLSTLMLHHLPGKLRSQCAVEVRRVLKPGGRVLAIDFGTSPGEKGIVAHFTGTVTSASPRCPPSSLKQVWILRRALRWE